MKSVIFLHGALGSASGWQGVLKEWNNNFKIFVPDLPGHGSSTELPSEVSLQKMVSHLERFISANVTGNYIIIGYSMGGYIALKYATAHRENLKGIITIATKFNWNKDIAETAASNLTKEKLEGIWDKIEAEHGRNARTILQTTQQILRSVGSEPLTKADLSRIDVPVKILRGDRDNMVTHEETELFAGYFGDAKTDILINQPHLLQKMDARALRNVLEKLTGALLS